MSDNYKTEELCTVCAKWTEGGNALHHVKTRGSGGTDEPENLMPLCFSHHTEVHLIGLKTFSSKYPKVHQWLVTHGWSISRLTKKWSRDL